MSSLDKLRPFFDVVDIAPQDWPVRCSLALPTAAAAEAWGGVPAALLPKNGRVAGGCGLSRDAAENSALGEAAELASSILWGDEAVLPPEAPVGDMCHWDLSLMLGFSRDQNEGRDTWNQWLDGTDWIPPPDMEEVGWVIAEDAFCGDPVRVPAEFVFLGCGRPAVRSLADSSGCAAGENDAAARLAAVLELIERDATGRWWYGQRERPLIDLEILAPEFHALVDWCDRHGRRVKIFDITTDLGVPVAAAATDDPDTSTVALGFAAGLSRAAAAEKAVIEMGQMLLLVEAGLKTDRMRPGLRRWVQEVSWLTPPLSASGTASGGGAPMDAAGVLSAMEAHGLRLAFRKMTRDPIGLPAWRAISPDLCHWKPRFGRARLLACDQRDIGNAAASANPVLLRL